MTFTDWKNEALDAAISQLKALRFSTGLTAREQMKIVLHAAEAAQREAVIEEIVAGAIGTREASNGHRSDD